MFREIKKIRYVEEDKRQNRIWSMIPQLIFTIFISMLIGFLIFLLIDRIFDLDNAFAPFGILFGLITGWMAAFKLYQNAMEKKKKEKPEEELK